MEIRRLEAREHGRTRRLYEDIFSEDSQGFVDYYYSEKTKDNVIYVAEEDHGIRAMIHLNPYKLWVDGDIKKAHYIVAVATQKEYRKRGFMAALLSKALKDLYGDKEAFTYLMPASEAIYLPFDFRTVYRQNQTYYHAGDEKMKDICIEEAGAGECAELAGYANHVLSEECQVFAYRDEKYYKRLIEELRSDGGKLLIYKKNGGIFDIRPCVLWKEQEAPKIMVRIVHLKRMLMSLKLRSLAVVCFCVTDPIIRDNNCCLVMSGTEFSGVMLMPGEECNSEGSIPVAALASLVFGAKSVEEICEGDGARMTERMKEEMRKIIPLSSMCLNETV